MSVSNSVEAAKNVVDTMEIPNEAKIHIQRLLTGIRGEALHLERENIRLECRTQVFAEVVDKVLSRLEQRY
jgi:hypothetical protein